MDFYGFVRLETFSIVVKGSQCFLGAEPYQQWLSEGTVVNLQNMAMVRLDGNHFVVLTNSDFQSLCSWQCKTNTVCSSFAVSFDSSFAL